MAGCELDQRIPYPYPLPNVSFGGATATVVTWCGCGLINRQPTTAGQRQPTNSPTANKPTDKQALVSLPPLPSFQTASSSSSRRSIHQPFFTSAAQQQQHSLSTVPSADLTFCLTVDSVAQRAFFALSSKQVVAPAPPASTRGSFSCSSSNSEAFYKSLSSSNSSSRTVAPLT